LVWTSSIARLAVDSISTGMKSHGERGAPSPLPAPRPQPRLSTFSPQIPPLLLSLLIPPWWNELAPVFFFLSASPAANSLLAELLPYCVPSTLDAHDPAWRHLIFSYESRSCSCRSRLPGAGTVNGCIGCGVPPVKVFFHPARGFRTAALRPESSSPLSESPALCTTRERLNAPLVFCFLTSFFWQPTGTAFWSRSGRRTRVPLERLRRRLLPSSLVGGFFL